MVWVELCKEKEMVGHKQNNGLMCRLAERWVIWVRGGACGGAGGEGGGGEDPVWRKR